MTEQRQQTPFSVNFFAGAGYVVEDARIFITRSGRPKVTFRMVVPRSPRLPKKNPEHGDFYSVIGVGERFAHLVDHLRQGAPVVVFGYIQSRDIRVDGAKRTVNEVGAEAIYLIQFPGEDNGGGD